MLGNLLPFMAHDGYAVAPAHICSTERVSSLSLSHHIVVIIYAQGPVPLRPIGTSHSLESIKTRDGSGPCKHFGVSHDIQ